MQSHRPIKTAHALADTSSSVSVQNTLTEFRRVFQEHPVHRQGEQWDGYKKVGRRKPRKRRIVC